MFSLNSFAKGWDEFFYSKTDPSGLCVFRIIFGFFLVLNGVSLIQDFHEWFGVGDNSLVPLMDSFNYYRGERLNIYRWLNPDETSAWIVLITYIAASFSFLIGFKTRISTIICFILMVSMQNRNYAILNSGDTIMRCLLFLMMFAPMHVKYSVDSFLKKKTGESYPEEVTILTIRLLQLQFSLVYFATTLWKLKGYDWVDGTAVYYTSRLINFQRFVLPVVFDYPALIKMATWGALFVEFAMGTLVWVKELRLPVLIAGVVLHLFIEVTMSIGFFEWVMISAYILFLKPQEIFWFKQKLYSLFPSRIRPALG